MKVKAFGYNIGSPEEEELILSMIKVLDPDATPEVIDLMAYDEVSIDQDDIILLFGRRAQQRCNDYKCRARLDLRETSRLMPGFGEYELRLEALEKLEKFKDELDSDYPTGEITTKEVTEQLAEDPLPSYSSNQLEKLESNLKKESKREFTGILEDGRTFRISEELSNEADICLTFTELKALKEAKEILAVQGDLKIVHRNSTFGWKNNPR